MSRKPTSEHGGKEVFEFRIHIILLEPSSPYVCHRHVLSELEGFCGEPLLRPFALFSLIVRLIHHVLMEAFRSRLVYFCFILTSRLRLSTFWTLCMVNVMWS